MHPGGGEEESQANGISQKALLTGEEAQLLIKQHLKAGPGQGQSEEHGPGHRPEVLAAPSAGVSSHLAWTEGPPQALAPPQPRLPPRCRLASLDLPRVVCTPLPGPMGKAGRAEGSWSLSPPRLGGGQESASVPGTCSQGGSEDAGSELPAAG